jgi:hypothetical protein
VTERPVGRGVAIYGLSCVLVIGLASGVFVALYGSTPDRLVAQSQGGNLIAGWGLGAVICMLVLVVYGFVCRPLGLPPSAALLSLATFFFLTELIEAPLLTI